jgi:RNA polymerase sigma factor (sigma-70 family)
MGKSSDDFPTTRWTLVVTAGGNESQPGRDAALDSLCRSYWHPVYAFIRRRGYPPEPAQDLTQEFFLRVLSGTFFERANPEKGRFRSFVLGAIKNFLADSSDRERAWKRGGGVTPLPFDFETGESLYLREFGHDETPERIFQRKWARAVLDRVVNNLQSEFLKEGKVDRFHYLKGYLTGSGEGRYAELATRLETSEPALRSTLQRLRQRYRFLLRVEVESTVSDPADVDEELRFLVQAMSTRPMEAAR